VKELNYFQILKESFSDYKKNLNIIQYWIISILLILIPLPIVAIQGLLIFVIAGPFWENPTSILIPTLPLFLLIIFIIFDTILMIILGSMSRSLMIGMIHDLAIKKKLKTTNIVPYIKKYWKQLLGARIVILLIVLIFLLVSALLIMLGVMINPILGFVIGIPLFLLFIALSITLGIFFFFLEPVIVIKKKSAVDSLKLSIQYAKKKISHVLFSWLTIFVCSLILGVAGLIITSIVLIPLGLVTGFDSNSYLILSQVFDIVSRIIFSLISIGFTLFVFKAYIKSNA